MASTRRAYAGGAQSTTTASAIASSGTTSFTITAYTGWPYGSDPFFIVVQPGTASEEKILVTRTGSTDTTINIASDSERAQDGTSAVGHSSGSIVFPVFTALDADEANAIASIITADTTNDRIGIGSATPARPFEVQSSVGILANFESSGTSSYITFTGSGSTDNTQVRVGAVNDEMRLFTGGAEAVRIDSSGNVGINDSSPSYTLDVDGDINTQSDLLVNGISVGRGLLAYAEIDSDFTLGTSYTDILSVSFTVPATRRVLLQGIVSRIDNPSTTLQAIVQLRDGAAGTGTLFQQAMAKMSTTIDVTPLNNFVIRQYTAGTYSVYMSAATNTGTARVNNNPVGRFSVLAVYDVGEP